MRKPQIRHHKHSNQVIVFLDGRYRYFGCWDDRESHDRAHRAIVEYLAAGGHHRVKGQSITVAELVIAAQKADELRDSRDKRAIPHLLELYGSCQAEEFSPLKLKAVRQSMIDKGWVRREVNLCTQRLKRLFRWGVAEELFPANVAHALDTVFGLRKGQAPESRKVNPVTEVHFRAVLPHLAPQLRAVAEIQWWTGMRSGEVLSMRPCDIDRTSTPWIYRPASHKTQHLGKSRAIPIGPLAQAVLTPWLNRPGDQNCFRPCESKPHGGEQYRTDWYATAISSACKKAGVPHFHPHMIRHAVGSRVRAAFGLDAAQAVLGHANASMTERYAELTMVRAAGVMREAG